jgi:hypothetical protein
MLEQQIQKLSDDNAQRILVDFASHDLSYKTYALTQIKPDLTSAAVEQGELARAALQLATEDPWQRPIIDSLLDSPPLPHNQGSTDKATVLAASVFLLRSHIKCHPAAADGGWTFTITHKPGDSAVMTVLLDKLNAILPLAGESPE